MKRQEDTVRKYNIYLTGVLRGEIRKIVIFKKEMAKNFPELIKSICLQTKEVQQILRKLNKKKYKPISQRKGRKSQTLGLKNNQEEKMTKHLQKMIIQIIVDFSIATMEAIVDKYF